MRVIGLLSGKGGVGKSTIAIHLAVAAAESGREKVVLVDCDPQGSALAWSMIRESAAPQVIASSASELPKALSAAAEEGKTLAFIDTAAKVAPDAAKVAGLSDLLVVPTRPSVLDLTAMVDTLHMIQALKAKAVLVLSAVPFRAPEAAEAKEILKGYGLPMAGEIGDRRSFARAVASGKGITEYDPSSKAAGEIRSLWKHVKEKSK